MKVLILSNNFMDHKMTSILGSLGDLEVIKLTDISLALGLISQHTMDFIIVDCRIEKLGEICTSISSLNIIPIALLVRGHESAWGLLSDLEVNGFIDEKGSDAELAARIRTISRRFAKASTFISPETQVGLLEA